VDIFFPNGRLWITATFLVATLVSAGCSCRQAAKPAAADPDEEMVAAFEEMARLADRYGSDCPRWAEEQMRAMSQKRILGFNQRMRSMSDAERAAFRAKYASRIGPLQQRFVATTARCKDELARAALRPLEVHVGPDGAVR
jgi:hypothetical protein